ncbi:MAG: acylphosphatase [SAR324 cluster bacterium]|nr:acylphosphatase [SAR324 cluster bacterium]
MSSQKRIKLIIHGKVQGVGYRFSVKRKADSLGIMGYVKNLHDGSVFTTAQGYILALNNFIKWCYIGPQEALVSNIEKTYGEIKNFNEFRILY